ncbi:type II toxin-antitoxin system PemK/MazF family toxin [Streptomyces sp. NPDC048258]|uniref:type II toxin-antitoxin system PemK/MazF family toxin n=1 Tax=Streptomyces sp. NPDC048258 TaxID=3365527 RepID=UPI00371C9B6F
MIDIQRGSVWRVPTVGRERTVLVIEDSAVIRLHPGGIVCVLVQEAEDALDTLVTIPIETPVRGVVMAPDVSAFRPQRFEEGKLLGFLSPEDMERVERALRAVLDL